MFDCRCRSPRRGPVAIRSPGLLPLLLLLALSPGRAAAEPLLPPGAFPLLDEAMAAQARQFDAVNAAPFGLSLDAVPRDAAALRRLSEKGVVELDEERKAAMVSNLLVVLVSESQTQPIVNAGTLY